MVLKTRDMGISLVNPHNNVDIVFLFIQKIPFTILFHNTKTTAIHQYMFHAKTHEHNIKKPRPFSKTRTCRSQHPERGIRVTTIHFSVYMYFIDCIKMVQKHTQEKSESYRRNINTLLTQDRNYEYRAFTA